MEDSVGITTNTLDMENHRCYGEPTSTKDFARRRSWLITISIADWRKDSPAICGTGIPVCYLENPKTLDRHARTDVWLLPDPNAGLYGLHKVASRCVIFNADDSMIMIANNGFRTVRDLMLEVKLLICRQDQMITMVLMRLAQRP